LDDAIDHVVLIDEVILPTRLLLVELHARQHVTLDWYVCELEVLIGRQIVVQNAVRIDVHIKEDLQTLLCERHCQ
jgi:hypothetical protein